MILRWFRVLYLLVAALLCAAAELPEHVLVGYHDSWNELSAYKADQTTLARLPGYINLVLLAFARPSVSYKGDFSLSGTGLEYRMQGHVLHDAIALLKQRHPETRVLLSVGGAAYTDWDRLALPDIVAFVGDFQLDGIDIDFEPRAPQCWFDEHGHTACTTDKSWETIVARARAALPRPYLLTASVWSVGAYGEGAFRDSRPQSRYTGFMLPLLRSKQAGDLDLLSINAYDAGPYFDPLESFRSYREVWPGRLALGVEVRWPGGKGPFPSDATATALAREIMKDPRGGMMLYPLLAMPEGGPPNSPSGSALAMALCRGMGFAGCDEMVP